jgi:tRNA A-37 threonylcarbamoyl transferase component Bud32
VSEKPSKRTSGAFDSKNWLKFDQKGYHVRALAPFKKFRGLDIPWDHPIELEESTERIVKASRSRKVIKLAAGHFAAPVEVYVKRYNFRTWYRWLLRAGRKTRAREEFDLGWTLMQKGIRTPRPVWLAEASGAVSQYSLLATEALPDVESAVQRWMRCEEEPERHELLVALGRFVGMIHDAGFHHDDFKAAHVLIFPHRPSLPQEFFLIDLLGGSFPPILTSLRRAKNLYQIIRSFMPKRHDLGFTQEHRDVFLLAYSGGAAQDALDWSRWVNRVGRLKGRKL